MRKLDRLICQQRAIDKRIIDEEKARAEQILAQCVDKPIRKIKTADDINNAMVGVTIEDVFGPRIPDAP